MPAIFAAEGGYQEFVLNGGEWAVLVLSALAALLAIAVGFYLAKSVLAAGRGHARRCSEIAKAIQEGAAAYLKRQFRTIAVILVPVAVDRVLHVDDDRQARRRRSALTLRPGRACSARWRSSLGCVASGLTGYIGMTLATRGNVRTAAAAMTGSMPEALDGGLPHRRRRRHVHRRPRPARRDA